MRRWLPFAGRGGRVRGSGVRVLVAVGLLATLTVIGTVGYMWIEGVSFIDGLYMAVITLSTVGYREVDPLEPAGRLFTVGFIVVGVGAAAYAVASVAEYLIEGRLREAFGRRAMDRSIQTLRDHAIICGYGRLGRVVVEELERAGTPVVIVDVDAAVQAELEEAGRPFVIGSALEESVLRRAGIAHARAIVTATPSDPDNVFVALSARELNPDISVHARGETEPGIRRLRLAGADQVISIHHLGGRRIANAIVRPAVVDFLELSSPGVGAPIDLEEVVLGAGSGLADGRVRDLADRGVHVAVVAIRRDGETIQLRPGPDDALRAGDHVVVVGDRENVRRLAALAEESSKNEEA